MQRFPVFPFNHKVIASKLVSDLPYTKFWTEDPVFWHKCCNSTHLFWWILMGKAVCCFYGPTLAIWHMRIFVLPKQRRSGTCVVYLCWPVDGCFVGMCSTLIPKHFKSHCLVTSKLNRVYWMLSLNHGTVSMLAACLQEYAKSWSRWGSHLEICRLTSGDKLCAT